MKKKLINTPLVSIIMNCHNGEKYLKKSIISVIKQTYKNWELVFFDNISTDKSKKILLGFKDKRIKYFNSKKYFKLYKARNLAIRKAKGDYLAFLDTDDWWNKNKLKEQVNFINKNKKYQIVYSNFLLYWENKKKFTKKYDLKLPSGKITQELLNDYFIAISSALINIKIFKSRIFNEKYNIIGDFDFFIYISRYHLIGAINKPLLYYRLHSENTSNKKIDVYFREQKNWLQKNKKKLLRENYNLSKLKFYLIKLKLKVLLKNIINKAI